MSEEPTGCRGNQNVVAAHKWLAETIESLLAQHKYVAALRALNRLLEMAEDVPTKLFCYENLGMVAYSSGRVDQARRAFEHASELSSTDPGLSYALGHCAAADGRWWRALMHYLVAIHRARDAADEAEFMRSGAIAAEQLGFSDTALSMFLGAVDRDPDNPWILESISHFYEHEGRWFDALDVREALVDVLADGIPRSAWTDAAPCRAAPNPHIDRIIRRFISLWTLDRQAIQRRVQALNERLRGEIKLVQTDQPTPAADAGLMALNLPAGLDLLVEQLAMHKRNFLLLESAQSLWARARHDDFDIHLTAYTLAGAIQAVCERLHWREPASFGDLERIYGVPAEIVRAATRLVAGRYRVHFFPEHDHYIGLSSPESQRLVQVQRAILYGVDLRELESAGARLAD